jgi:serine/threonine-protein kinase
MLSDRYRVDLFLASGGMGEVWRATDIALQRLVAVKVLLPAVLTNPSFAVRFRAEARILAAFHHPNVVDVYDYGESTIGAATVAYLVMAYVDGEPLSQRIAAAGRLSVAETMSLVAQVAEALHAVHLNGVVHRDVKPGNLLVRTDGAVILVDFGVAHSSDTTAMTNAADVPGTVLYMAPEQVSGRPVSAATDIYALGAVAYHCLAGHPPFDGKAALEVALQHVNDDLPSLPTDVPEPVRDLVGRAMAKHPADRYPTAGAFAAAARAAGAHPAGEMFETAAASGAAYQGPATTPDPAVAAIRPAATRPPRRRKATVTAAAATGLVAAAGLTAVLTLTPASNEPPAGVDAPVQSTAPASPSARPRATRPAQPSPSRATPSAATPSPQTIPTRSASPDGSAPPTARPTPAPTIQSPAPTTTSTPP